MPSAEVKADPGVVGDVFFIERARYERGKPIMLAGCVAPGTATYLVPPLDGAKVTRIRPQGILITGLEQVDAGRYVHQFKQTWWCIPVDLVRVAAPDAPRPVPAAARSVAAKA